SDLSALDWPTGFVRRESVESLEERKWKHTKWAWRSTGTVQHEGHAAEIRTCLGVFRCESCNRLTRPKTQPGGRKAQIAEGCTSTTCHIDAPLVHDKCKARTFHYRIQRGGESVLVWEHFGDHSTHDRPPGGTTLSKWEEDQVDSQVMRKPEASAHALRTGDPAPGSVPFADISPALAAPGAARYQQAQSHIRLGIHTGSTKSAIAVMSGFGDLNKRLSTPFLIDDRLGGPVYMTFQTPWMDEMIGEAVESWIVDLASGPEASRHGFAVDGDHTYFKEGQLLVTCAFSTTSREWTPVLYSWINGLDTAHHRPHFAQIFKSIIKHAGDRFTRKLLLCVMDFSGAQRSAHAQEYAEAIISITPGFTSLSKEAQAAERCQLILEAEQAEVGCEVHFWCSADHIKKTHSLVPPHLAPFFEQCLCELISPKTTSERFDTVLLNLKTTFPEIKSWISWWERRPIASMIFPAKSAVDLVLAAKVPSTSNPVEHSHSLLHHAVGSNQELFPGIEKLWLHAREMQKKQEAIKAGYFNAGDVRDCHPQKPRTWDENDGWVPDTIAALAAADAAAALNGSSYAWDSPNSCFFDTGLELWFRAFSRWSDTERAAFLAAVPARSGLATIFFHFQRRLQWVTRNSGGSTGSIRKGEGELGLGQSLTRMLIFHRWNLYPDPTDYGCATTWLWHALRDYNTGLNIHLLFSIVHQVSGVCPSNHATQVRIGGIQDLFRINLFDLRATRRKGGAATSLTEYFAHCTPRIYPGNDEGGSCVLHTLPAPLCEHPGCARSMERREIETLWPKVLQINPESGTELRLPIDRSFSIDDGSGGQITYELIGSTSFDFPRKHWTSNVLIGGTTFHYDDLVQRGSLVAQGPADLISTPDSRAVLLIYHRTSTSAKVRMNYSCIVTHLHWHL
ncbi:hypothetical protein C8R43DRAFT_903545, partial [Mycena crocata]